MSGTLLANDTQVNLWAKAAHTGYSLMLRVQPGIGEGTQAGHWNAGWERNPLCSVKTLQASDYPGAISCGARRMAPEPILQASVEPVFGRAVHVERSQSLYRQKA